MACALAGALWLSAASVAEAARLADLRVGAHDDFTRVVLELDKPAGYRLVAPRAGGAPQLLLFVEAQATPRQIPGKTPLVEGVTAQPTAQGVTVRIDLARSDVDVSEMILREPPRIVLDLRAKGAAPTAAAKNQPAPKPETAEPAMPVVALPASIAAGAGQASADAPAGAPIEVSAANPEPSSPAAETSPGEDRSKAEVEGASTQSAAEEAPGDGVQAAELAAEPIVAERPAAAPPPAAVPPTPKRTAPTRPASSEGSLLWSPMGLMVLGVVVIGIGFAIARRRRAAAEDDPLFPVMSAEHAGLEPDEEESVGVSEVPRPSAQVAVEDASFERLPEASDSPSLPFAPPAEEPQEAACEDESESIFEGAPAESPASPVEEPEPVLPASALEQRMRELEDRLEQLVHSRERLERQVAAQTEELRVQRAAIARTQRVVRTLSKPEDPVTEPVPRST